MWPFRRGPAPAIEVLGPEGEVPPGVAELLARLRARAAGTPGFCGDLNAPEAPEDWPPDLAAEFARQQAAAVAGRRRCPAWDTREPMAPGQEARVYPRIGATRRDLVALGVALRGWHLGHPYVEAIEGLDRLLAGAYPGIWRDDGPSDGSDIYAPGWQVCPAIVRLGAGPYGPKHFCECLVDELPEGVYSHHSDPREFQVPLL